MPTRTISTLLLGLLVTLPGMALADAKPATTPAAQSVPLATENLGPLELTQTSANRVLKSIRENRAVYESDSEALYAMVDELILKLFDFRTMSLLVLGPNWKSASPEQQDRFVEGFRNLLVRTYSKALLQAGDAEIIWEPLDLAPGDTRTMVSAQVPTTSGPIKMNWRLRQLKNVGWRVYDVVVDGISLVTNYRGSYNAEIRKVGLDGLIEKLEKSQG